jgi:hypothetical protein
MEADALTREAVQRDAVQPRRECFQKKWPPQMLDIAQGVFDGSPILLRPRDPWDEWIRLLGR